MARSKELQAALDFQAEMIGHRLRRGDPGGTPTYEILHLCMMGDRYSFPLLDELRTDTGISEQERHDAQATYDAIMRMSEGA